MAETMTGAAIHWVLTKFHPIPRMIVKILSDFKPIRLKELTPPNEQVVSLIPKWRTLWKMDNPADEKWARKHIDILQQCGFRVYEYPKMGLLLGLDEVKGDLYKNYWTPLYQARHKA